MDSLPPHHWLLALSPYRATTIIHSHDGTLSSSIHPPLRPSIHSQSLSPASPSLLARFASYNHAESFTHSTLALFVTQLQHQSPSLPFPLQSIPRSPLSVKDRASSEAFFLVFQPKHSTARKLHLLRVE